MSHYAQVVVEITILVLAVFLGVEVISKVPTLLHTPLMSGTNAIHGIVLVGAIVVAGILMSGVKGSRLHRVLGWCWASFMLLTAVSALFIRAPTGLPSVAGVGVLHVFSAATLVLVPLAVAAARRHDVARHARMMTGLVGGGLGVAGLFAFLPRRLLWTVFFG